MTNDNDTHAKSDPNKWEKFRIWMIAWFTKNYVLIAVVIGIVLIGLSLRHDLDGPDPALIEWTEWATLYIALVVAAQKIWKVSDVAIAGLARRLDVD